MASSSSSSITQIQCASAVNVANFVSTKLHLHQDSNNYISWKEQMLCLIESQDLLGIIDGEIPPPPKKPTNDGKTDNQDYIVWRRTDRLVKGWILGALSPKVVQTVVEFDTARDVWLGLENKFKGSAPQPPAAEQGGNDWHKYLPLHKAALRGEWDTAKAILDQDPDAIKARETEDFKLYLPLYKAALGGDWKTAEKLFEEDINKTKAIISSLSETALHVAVRTGKANYFVKKLVELLPDDALALKDNRGNTALHCAASVGNKEAAIMLINRKPDLQYITNMHDRLPVQKAAISCQKDTLKYLISKSEHSVNNSPFAGKLGVRLLVATIASGFFDVALDLVENYPDLATTGRDVGYCALSEIAKMSSAFPGGESFSWWQNLIYSYIPLKSSRSRFDWTKSVAGDVENHNNIDALEHKKSICFQITSGVPQVKRIANKKLMHQQALELVKRLCQKIESLPSKEASAIYEPAIILAAENGIHEVVQVIIETFPMSIFTDQRGTGRNIFLLAVSNRFENVFNLIYNMSDHKYLFYDWVDSSDNNFMHLCSKIAPSHKLNLVSGAALQMQRELQWFKEMEKFVNPSRRVWENNDGDTPKMLFTKEHKELKAEGERWMKDTANSCTIAAALIATVAFAAAFTVPGGIATETGIPIFWNRLPFILFAISDAISLFTAITSLLMFLSILTSRYAEEDFLYVLPNRLSIGLLTLFISITFMLAAFSATLYLVLVKQEGWLIIPVAAFACFPVASFVLLQFPLLVDVVYSTHGPGIFGKKSGDRLLY